MKLLAILKFTPRGAADIIAKVVKSAKANAENNHEMDADKLYVASIVANQGPTIKDLCLEHKVVQL